MIIDGLENQLFKRLSRNETQWRIKNFITCSKCLYGCYRETDPHCDYISYVHKSKRCTSLTCIQRGIFVPRSDRIDVKRMKKKYAKWLNEQFERDAALAEMWELLNDGKHGFARDPELSGGGDVQGDAGLHEEAMQTDEVRKGEAHWKKQS